MTESEKIKRDLKELEQYSSRAQLWRNNLKLYARSRLSGALDLVFPTKIHAYRSDATLIEESKKYESRRELRKRNRSLYVMLSQRHLLDKAYPINNKQDGRVRRNITISFIKEVISKFDNLTDLNREEPYITQKAIEYGFIISKTRKNKQIKKIANDIKK